MPIYTPNPIDLFLYTYKWHLLYLVMVIIVGYSCWEVDAKLPVLKRLIRAVLFGVGWPLALVWEKWHGR